MKKHPHVNVGQCPVCYHYGDDCTGQTPKTEKPVRITKDEWTEIYYALNYKLTSPAMNARCKAQLSRIMMKIGLDGDLSAKRGVK